MSIEDINYMKDNSIKQAYTFIIDSSDRDRNVFPNPNNYVINFSTPFKNVIGMEIIDASIPRAMYTVDVDNNELYYYVGRDNADVDADEIITNGMQIENNANLILKNCSIIDEDLVITDQGYAILDNSINIYNIYNNKNNIGGNSIGITFNIRFKPYFSSTASSGTYNIYNFTYDHTYYVDANIINNIRIDILKEDTLYTLKFTIGTTIKTINNNDYNFMNGNYINLYWSVSETTWCIYVFNNSNQQIYKNIFNDNLKKILNVFYTKKYIGRSIWGTTNRLLLKHFKIYNTSMTYTDMENANGSTQSNTTIPVWYEMNKVNLTVINKGYNAKINYKDIFKKITITPGDYNFNTFISKYDDLIINNEVEFRFNETTTISSLSNLIDIISKAPLIIDMKRSTLAENLGFDLYPTIDNDRYIYKNKYMENEMDKMFQSRERTVQDKYHNDEFPIDGNKYMITSPGIVYFIGNKYIILRCPEIEEHLYRSLSFSKYSLGLAKFRVDSIGINNEKLSITKIPVREFHPIGKLSRLTLKFETNKGTLYDFKGVNHNIIFAIFYYEPIQKNIPTNSILNPSYKMNYIDYQYKQEEIEGDSSDGDNEEDTEDFSRDNIDEYKIKENLYNERGVKLQQFKNYYENNNVNDIIDIEDDNDNNDEDNDNNDSIEDDNDDINYY